MKILVADDDDILRRMLVLILTKMGHQVLEASDGGKALELLRDSANSIDIAILDWAMPEIDGIDICQKLRDENCPSYLILLTGKSSDQDVTAALRAGAHDYMTKPFSENALRVRLLVGVEHLEFQRTLLDRIASWKDLHMEQAKGQAELILAADTILSRARRTAR